MSRIYKSMEELIGKTPLLELTHIEKAEGLKARVLAKMEYLNATGSVKDRVALNMILDAEEKGILKEGSVIIEPTSGNTGIGLAAVGTSKGYRVIIVMPDTMSVERRRREGNERRDRQSRRALKRNRRRLDCRTVCQSGQLESPLQYNRS